MQFSESRILQQKSELFCISTSQWVLHTHPIVEINIQFSHLFPLKRGKRKNYAKRRKMWVLNWVYQHLGATPKPFDKDPSNPPTCLALYNAENHYFVFMNVCSCYSYKLFKISNKNVKPLQFFSLIFTSLLQTSNWNWTCLDGSN